MSRSGWSALACAAFAALAVVTRAGAQPAVLPVNGNFEAGATGWAPATGGTFVIDGSQPVNGGAAAGHAQSSAAGTVTVRTQYWLSPAIPGRLYALSLAVRVPAATISAVTARLEVVDGAGASLVSNAVARAGATGGYVTLNTTQLTAPPAGAFLLVVVSGTATAPGARFSIDDVTITETIPPPPPPPPPEPAAPPEDPGPAVLPAPAIIASRPSATPIRLPSATPTRPPSRPVLSNGTFEANLTGWNVARGRAWTDAWIPGQGASLVLYTPAAVTIWAEQVITGIQPGGWYQASALLSARGSVTGGWLRIAWHASDDGSGSALANDDSLEIDGRAEHGAVAPAFRTVGTGPVQAPYIAGSATIRMLLRADGGDAWLLADDVTFGPAEPPGGPGGSRAAPPAAPAVPVPTIEPATVMPGAFAGIVPPRATPAARATPRATTAPPRAQTPAARLAPTPTPMAAVPDTLRALDVVAPGVADHQRAVRITQVLPDPANAGRDSDYEWVELTNLGTAAVSLEGMTLRDNAGAITLPPIVLPAGGAVVLTARLAEVPGVTSWRLAQGIGNGLGNAGDRLSLTTADGRQVDAFSYGEDTTFLNGARIPAPGTGRAIERRFGPDGVFRDAVVLDQPTPGRRRPASEPPGAAAPEKASVAGAAGPGAATGAVGTWVVLLAVGGGLLGGIAAQRVALLARGGDA